MPSHAHRRSRSAIIDPVYAVAALAPRRPARGTGVWLYGPGELEAWRLGLVRTRGYRDCVNVFHPGLFHRPQQLASFRCTVTLKAVPRRMAVRLRVVGGFTLQLRGTLHHQALPTDEVVVLDLAPRMQVGDNQIAITVFGIAEPGCLQVDGLDGAVWEWCADGFHWGPAHAFPAGDDGQPPHRDELIEVPVTPVATVDGLVDFGVQLLAKPIIRARAKNRQPRLFVGESPAEAHNADKQGFEQRLDLRQRKDGTWISDAALALRYVRVEDGTVVGAQAAFHPARYRGAFACSDERLTAIWMRGAYTLRLCLHDFLIDGVKRDRMPWVGDFALALLGNAYAFHDQEIVRRTLVALAGERVDECMLNAIIDYSLWWIISLDLYATHFGDVVTVRAQWPQLLRLLAVMEASCDQRGYLIPRAGDWLFVDWIGYDHTGAVTALQALWVWALDAAARVATLAGADGTVYNKRAASVRRRLRREGFSRELGAYRESLDNPTSGPSRHASFLAVLAGVADRAQGTAIAATLRGTTAPAVGTPYMGAFEALALARLGDTGGMLTAIRATWGGMLDLGATTFWEAYDPTHQGDQHYGFYGRPFAKSLCHAWGAGPVALLPAELLGIRPLADGWTRFAVAPALGDLTWASATVPTPHGDIEVVCDGSLRVTVPRGTVAVVDGRELKGGKTHSLAWPSAD